MLQPGVLGRRLGQRRLVVGLVVEAHGQRQRPAAARRLRGQVSTSPLSTPPDRTLHGTSLAAQAHCIGQQRRQVIEQGGRPRRAARSAFRFSAQ